MKNLKFKIVGVFLVFVLLAGFTGCKKDDVPLSRKDLLTSHNWKMSSFKINGVAQVIEDCSKDDFLKFGSDGTVRYEPGPVKCSDDPEMVSVGWYKLSSDEKTMSITEAGVSQGITIVELTESKFVISIEEYGIVMEEPFIAF